MTDNFYRDDDEAEWASEEEIQEENDRALNVEWDQWANYVTEEDGYGY